MMEERIRRSEERVCRSRNGSAVRRNGSVVRLSRSGEVVQLRVGRKKTVYAWKRPVVPVAVTDDQGGVVAMGPDVARWLPGPTPPERKKK